VSRVVFVIVGQIDIYTLLEEQRAVAMIDRSQSRLVDVVRPRSSHTLPRARLGDARGIG